MCSSSVGLSGGKELTTGVDKHHLHVSYSPQTGGGSPGKSVGGLNITQVDVNGGGGEGVKGGGRASPTLVSPTRPSQTSISMGVDDDDRTPTENGTAKTAPNGQSSGQSVKGSSSGGGGETGQASAPPSPTMKADAAIQTGE